MLIAMDLRQPLLVESVDEDVVHLEEGRGTWWDGQSDRGPGEGLTTPSLSAFARIQDSAPASPTGSGRASMRHSPRSQSTQGTKKGGGKGPPRESRARWEGASVFGRASFGDA